ncbi:MAG TPA: GNAT family N-acetyltransferase [Acetobacteraceae bacterium]|nr:GNAT family N-acetyltransferase [Acetobacteraceae bacterium]
MVTGAGFTLREALPADVPALHRLMRCFAAYEKLTDRFTISEAQLQDALFGSRPVIEAILAEADGAAIGFAVWYFLFGTFSGRLGLFVEDVFVEQSWRGRGIGLALFRHMARVARQRHCAQMLWEVLDWNTPAIDFYRRIGATPVRGWTTQQLSGDALSALAAGANNG